jgi:hypothetical protein
MPLEMDRRWIGGSFLMPTQREKSNQKNALREI